MQDDDAKHAVSLVEMAAEYSALAGNLMTEATSVPAGELYSIRCWTKSRELCADGRDAVEREQNNQASSVMRYHDAKSQCSCCKTWKDVERAETETKRRSMHQFGGRDRLQFEDEGVAKNGEAPLRRAESMDEGRGTVCSRPIRETGGKSIR